MTSFFVTESGHRSDTGSGGYWQIQLDRDLVDTIAAIYPEWVSVRGGTSSGTNAGALPTGHSMAEGTTPVVGASRATVSPPKAVVDSSPLANTMEQNKQCKSIPK